MKRLLATILLLSLLTMPALAVTTPEEDELSLTAPSAAETTNSESVLRNTPVFPSVGALYP